MKKYVAMKRIYKCYNHHLQVYRPYSFQSSSHERSIFDTNIGSLSKYKEELEVLLNMLDFKFDIICISETKLVKNIKPKFNINLTVYK